MNSLRNRVAELGGDVFLMVDSDTGGFGSSAQAEAYDCGSMAQQPPRPQ